MKRKVLIGLGVVVILFIVIQFIPGQYNQSKQTSANNIAQVYSMPQDVQAILKKDCYDCHSNNTNYPFYAHLQPMRLMLDRHVRNGKDELNFDEFGTYSARKKRSKLRAISTSLDEGTMPLPSYLIIHRDAALNPRDTALIKNWIRKVNE
ncbi:cytochrome C [Mucilaginibacter rubeus]|uniref:Cytochrome C n=2 Tax=Mucilaginibacter rubeus TaxID=2027860 RepID=A0A364WQT0_9SPHI|nr:MULTISPECIES: heme-binding domain-containing protein [Mucilaginibacter]QEM06132.1 cytochrome C [Mucilaginibacter rubeus]QEM13649.1 cytochrome C [Mucilaginibacter rubeus]QEM18712.1 cytochrome C [Mucilaginibacter gossypii]QTE36294.1 heme-binding domain-containing protein [Mucilaginibacter gossypii]QTE44747.1 heme-binding domain-containing protein [Mucilaginibacter rubeus]